VTASIASPILQSGFTRAEYIINKKDSSITQVMKDSSGMIRQVVIIKNKKEFIQHSIMPMVN
jgi:hypothetical protein